MAQVSIRPTFISIGCNRTPNASDISRKSGRIAFGAHNSIALWNPLVPVSRIRLIRPQAVYDRGIYATIKGHTGVVNAVRWVESGPGGVEEFLASGSVDRSVRIWKENDHGVNPFTSFR